MSAKSICILNPFINIIHIIFTSKIAYQSSWMNCMLAVSLTTSLSLLVVHLQEQLKQLLNLDQPDDASRKIFLSVVFPAPSILHFRFDQV